MVGYHIEYLDYQMWQYITKLKEMGELDNTVIFFLADNGTRGWKASVVRQRGMHVPFVVYAPGQPELVQGAQDIIADLSDMLPTLADIMGTQLPKDYELSGKSLWPYLTKRQAHHRDWIYGFKGNKQMVRGRHLMRDGNGDWWDVSKIPSDLDSFPKIQDFSPLSPELQKEKEQLEQVLAAFAREDIGGPNSFHANPARKLTEQEIERMRAKEEALKRHLKQFE